MFESGLDWNGINLLTSIWLYSDYYPTIILADPGLQMNLQGDIITSNTTFAEKLKVNWSQIAIWEKKNVFIFLIIKFYLVLVIRSVLVIWIEKLWYLFILLWSVRWALVWEIWLTLYTFGACNKVALKILL